MMVMMMVSEMLVPCLDLLEALFSVLVEKLMGSMMIMMSEQLVPWLDLAEVPFSVVVEELRGVMITVL